MPFRLPRAAAACVACLEATDDRVIALQRCRDL